MGELPGIALERVDFPAPQADEWRRQQSEQLATTTPHDTADDRASAAEGR